MENNNSQDVMSRLAELEALNASLSAELNRVKALAKSRHTMKVSGKGAISVYGINKFPVTLYSEQWETVFSLAEDIRTFAIDHASELASKDKPVVTTAVTTL